MGENLVNYRFQDLLGHTSGAILRKYLAHNNEDKKQAHLKGSAVDNNIKANRTWSSYDSCSCFINFQIAIMFQR